MSFVPVIGKEGTDGGSNCNEYVAYNLKKTCYAITCPLGRQTRCCRVSSNICDQSMPLLFAIEPTLFFMALWSRNWVQHVCSKNLVIHEERRREEAGTSTSVLRDIIGGPPKI